MKSNSKIQFVFLFLWHTNEQEEEGWKKTEQEVGRKSF